MKTHSNIIITLWIFLMTTIVAVPAGAVTYPTYKSPVPHYTRTMGGNRAAGGVGQDGRKHRNGTHTPSTLTGGVTTTGEGGITTRRFTDYNSSDYGSTDDIENPKEGDTYTDGVDTYVWDSMLGWIKKSNSGANQGEADENQMPMGDPVLPLVLMAILACGAVYLRRRSRLA